jgi:hypothetical protein
MTVERGQHVVVSVIGANHGMRTDAASTALSHLTFGHGIHRCLGAPLARIQLASALRGLLDRFPFLALADDPAVLKWKTDPRRGACTNCVSSGNRTGPKTNMATSIADIVCETIFRRGGATLYRIRLERRAKPLVLPV